MPRTVPMSEIVARSAGYWFAPDTMKWFRTKLAKTAIMADDGRAYFVSSHQRDCDSARFWTATEQTPDGQTGVLWWGGGEWSGIAETDAETARAWCRALANTPADHLPRDKWGGTVIPAEWKSL